jgi:hypothetical protein
LENKIYEYLNSISLSSICKWFISITIQPLN